MNEIPYWLSVVAIFLSVWPGIAYGTKLHRHGFSLAAHVHVKDCPLIPAFLVLFVLLHVATGTILKNPQIGWALPVFIEYHLTSAMWLLKIFFVTFAMSAIVTVGFRQRHGMRYVLLLFTAVVIGGIEVLTHLSVQPFLGEIRTRVKDGIVLQTNASTCAAASAANIARYFGIDATEADMVKRLHTTWSGTAPSQIIYGLRELGLKARKVRIPDRDLAKVHPPAVLLVNVGEDPDAHAVTYMGRRGERFEIWDPVSGRWIASLEEVRARWGGRAIEVRRAGAPGD